MNFLQIGEQIETNIVAVSGDYIFLDLNAKTEGILNSAELKDDEGNITVKAGDKIKVFYLGEKNGEMLFTSKISSDKADKTILKKAFETGIPIEGFVESEIKGGYEVKIGQSRAFCPFSQMGYKQKQEPAFFIGKHLTFKIQEYKEDGKNILVSNRIICEEEHAIALQKIQEKLTEGMIVQACVDSIQSYGAFVMIHDFKALLPISEISLDRIEDVSKYLKIGQNIDVKIIKTDWKNEKVSVSLKALLADPWQKAKEKYPVESKHKATVSRVAEYGLFASLEPGLDGLVHISELQNVSSSTNLRKMFKKGDIMTVVIQDVDTDQKRISLRPAVAKEQEIDSEYYLDRQDSGETYNPFALLLKK